MKNRFIAWCMLVFLLLVSSGCAPSPAKVKLDTAQTKTLTFSLPAGSHEVVREQATEFAKKVEKLSGGKLIIQLDLQEQNRKDLYLASQEELVKKCDSLQILNVPFVFQDADHATMILNTELGKKNFYPAIERMFGATPLAVSYAGTQVMLCNSAWMGGVTSFEGLKVGILQDARMQYLLEGLGCEVTAYDNEAAQQQAFVKEEIGAAIFPVTLAGELNAEGKYALVPVNSHISTNWLLINEQLLEQLSEWEYAIIEEAAAYFTRGCNEGMLRWENNALGEEQAGPFLKSTLLKPIEGLRQQISILYDGWEEMRQIIDVDLFYSIQILAQ